MAADDADDSTGRQLPLFTFDEENLNKTKQYSARVSSDESKFGKYIVYVDESGDHSLQSIDPNYPVFTLAFCVFHKRHYSEVIVPALEKFKFNHFGHDQVFLHEHEIRKRVGVFNFSGDRTHQRLFMDELTDIVTFGNFFLISTTIDKLALTNSILKAMPTIWP